MPVTAATCDGVPARVAYGPRSPHVGHEMITAPGAWLRTAAAVCPSGTRTTSAPVSSPASSGAVIDAAAGRRMPGSDAGGPEMPAGSGARSHSTPTGTAARLFRLTAWKPGSLRYGSPPGRFYLHDVRALVGQETRRVRPGDARGELNDPDPVEAPDRRVVAGPYTIGTAHRDDCRGADSPVAVALTSYDGPRDDDNRFHCRSVHRDPDAAGADVRHDRGRAAAPQGALGVGVPSVLAVRL